MNKEATVCIYNGILLGYKKGMYIQWNITQL